MFSTIGCRRTSPAGAPAPLALSSRPPMQAMAAWAGAQPSRLALPFLAASSTPVLSGTRAPRSSAAAGWSRRALQSRNVSRRASMPTQYEKPAGCHRARVRGTNSHLAASWARCGPGRPRSRDDQERHDQQEPPAVVDVPSRELVKHLVPERAELVDEVVGRPVLPHRLEGSPRG